MALSDCVKCWETPCSCGYAYRNWTEAARQKLANVILNPPYPPDTEESKRRQPALFENVRKIHER